MSDANASNTTLRGKRILIAKPGLDGHDVGAKVIALALRDAGADVIYTGLRRTPGYIARVAVDEDVNAVGLSVLSGSHRELLDETLEQLKSLNAIEIPVFIGGTIPSDDIKALLEAGARAVFTADQSLDDVVAAVAKELA